MREFFGSIWFKILLVIAAICMGFIVYEASTGNISSPSALFGMIAQPFERAASSVSNAVGSFLDPFIHAGKYKDENEQLKQQIADLQNQLVDYNKLKTENEQLRDVAGVKELNPSFDMEPASVIARDADDAFGAFTINKGSYSGIEKNDAVITPAGLVGLVTDVGPTYSQVTTILSPDLSISANDSQTGIAGVVSGDMSMAAQGCCKMEHLDKDADVANGNLIITSGGSGVYPSNIIIGSVKEMRIQSNGISSYAVIWPAVDVKTVTEVTVVKDFEGKGVSASETND